MSTVVLAHHLLEIDAECSDLSEINDALIAQEMTEPVQLPLYEDSPWYSHSNLSQMRLISHMRITRPALCERQKAMQFTWQRENE